MKVINTILVPTDFSENSYQACNFAIDLAKKTNANLLFFHAYHIPINDPISPVYSSTGTINPGRQLMDEHERTIKEKLKRLCNDAKIKLSGTGISCESISMAGFLVDQIMETCKGQSVDIVVMGTQGATGLKEALLGSNTANVIEKVNCPVLAIPEDASFDSINNVIYATDYDEQDPSNIKRLTEFLEPFEVEFHLVHIYENQNGEMKFRMEEFKNEIENLMSLEKLNFHVFPHDSVSEGINAAITNVNADLLAMVRRKKGFFQNLFSKDLTTKMAYQSKLPLFVFHEE